jgi:uncharacterized protein YjeT (DUF2065 family)
VLAFSSRRTIGPANTPPSDWDSAAAARDSVSMSGLTSQGSGGAWSASSSDPMSALSLVLVLDGVAGRLFTAGWGWGWSAVISSPTALLRLALLLGTKTTDHT